MSRVWDETQFRGHELLVFLSLADHANDQGVCWPSQKTLAARARCSERTVKRIIAHLKSEGFIDVRQRWKADSTPNSNCYVLKFPQAGVGDKQTPTLVTHVTVGDKSSEVGDKTIWVGDSSWPQVGDTAMAHKPSGNHKIEPSKESPLAAPPSPPKKSLYFSDIQEIIRKRREVEDQEFIASLEAISTPRKVEPAIDEEWCPFE